MLISIKFLLFNQIDVFLIVANSHIYELDSHFSIYACICYPSLSSFHSFFAFVVRLFSGVAINRFLPVRVDVELFVEKKNKQGQI